MNKNINRTPYVGKVSQGPWTETRHIFRSQPPHRRNVKERFLTIISTPLASTHEQVVRQDWNWDEEQERYIESTVVVRPAMTSNTVQVVRMQRHGKMRTISLYGPQGRAWEAPK